MADFEIPEIPIKIQKEGEWMSFKVGKYKLRLKEQGNKEYDFVTLEQFFTNSAKLVYQKIIDVEQIRKDLASADK